MVRDETTAEMGVDQLAQIATFIIALDERMRIVWASDAVLRRRKDALGLKLGCVNGTV